MKHFLMLAAALAPATPAAARSVKPAARPAEVKLVDLTDDFDHLWTETSALPDSSRAVEFKRRFATVLPGFYDERRFGSAATDYDTRLLKKLKAYPDSRDGIRRVSTEFQARFRPALASFSRYFGPMAGYPPIYLVNSLGEFDGGTRALPEGTRLLFGADVIDKLYRREPIEPFFHHELFHLYHHAHAFPECEQGWCAIWTEGLAVYVGATLNPKAGDQALLLNFPRPIRPAVDGNLPVAVCTVRARLESTSFDDYRALFTGDGNPPDPALPKRYGYYVGYLVAKDLGRTRTLKQLAALKPEEVRPLIEASLARMATCNQPKQ